MSKTNYGGRATRHAGSGQYTQRSANYVFAHLIRDALKPLPMKLKQPKLTKDFTEEEIKQMEALYSTKP